MAEEYNGSTVITRVKYFKGQALTAQDFQDEQQYHSDKLRLLLQRFPTGIIRDLKVTKSDTDGITINAGIGVNANGDFLAISRNQTVYVKDTEMLVGDNQLFINHNFWDGTDQKKLYVNLSPKTIETIKTNSLCDSVCKNNRVEETVKITFDKSPDGPDAKPELVVTIAVLQLKDKGDFVVEENSPIVNNAGIINEDQVKFNEMTGHDHSGGSKGKQIGIDSFDPNLRFSETKISFLDNKDGHDHSGGEKGKKIGSAGIADWVPGDNTTGVRTSHIQDGAITKDKLDLVNIKFSEDNVVFDDKGHDHSGGEKGKKIPLSSIDLGSAWPEANIKFNDTNGHDHSGKNGNGKKINSDGIAEWTSSITGIKKEHIQNGAVTLEKLDDNLQIPETKVSFSNSGHDHSGNAEGKQIESAGIAYWTSDTTGIKKEHIQKGAITLDKLDKNLQLPENNVAFSNSGHDHSGNTGGKQIGSAGIAYWTSETTGIKTEHLQDGAVTLKKLEAGLSLTPSGEAHGDLTGQYPSPRIADHAVTSSKLGIVEFYIEATYYQILETKSNPPSNTAKPASISIYDVPENTLIMVIPLDGRSLKWEIDSITHSPEGLTYNISITPLSKDEAGNWFVTYSVRLIHLGAVV